MEGSTENATLARSLLSDLVDRGLDPEQGILFVIDGSKIDLVYDDLLQALDTSPERARRAEELMEVLT